MTIKEIEKGLQVEEARVRKLAADRDATQDAAAFAKADESHERALKDLERHKRFLASQQAQAAAAERKIKLARLQELSTLLGSAEPKKRLRPAAEKIAAALETGLAAIEELNLTVAELRSLHREARVLTSELGAQGEFPRFADTHVTESYDGIATGVVRCVVALRCDRPGEVKKPDIARYLQLATPEQALTALNFPCVRDARYPIAEQIERAIDGTYYERSAQLEAEAKTQAIFPRG